MGESVKIRAKLSKGLVEVKVLVSHEMETGLRKTPDGKLIPPKYIQSFLVSRNKRVVFKMHCGPAVSKNPFFSFQFSGAVVGDFLEVVWFDNTGAQGKGLVRVE